MNENFKTYIKLNAFLGKSFYIDEHIKELHCPRLCDIDIFLYHLYIYKFVDLYDDDEVNFFVNITKTKENINNFITLIFFFKKCSKAKFVLDKFIMEDEENNVFYIDKDNVSVFMETIKILHHMDKEFDNYKPTNKIAEQMLKRAKKLKKELEQKLAKKDGIGFLEIMSCVSARHNSINPLNIDQLNYYQIVDQFRRLNKIDEYEINAIALATNNLSEESKKNFNSYIVKLIND